MTPPELLVRGLPSGYEPENLARLFFPSAPVRQGSCTRGPLVYARAGVNRLAAGLRLGGRCAVRTAPRAPGQSPKRALSRLLYDLLREATGQRPPWGLLTGVRPVNLLRKTLAAGGEAAARQHLLGWCDVSPEKYALASQVAARQQPVLAAGTPASYSLYISIPFCPSRCHYCSFVSRTIAREGHLVPAYLEKLEQELALTAQIAAETGLWLESIYIGGGTPTALGHAQLDTLLQNVAAHFNTAAVREYTVEAGRPDCTDYEKLRILRAHGVTRLSINPQSMNDATLRAIGRAHTARDILRCTEDARRAGHENINMDLIAGLPGDDLDSFTHSLKAVLALAPQNITVHSLALKRASTLVVDHLGPGSPPGAMLAAAATALPAAGYVPYYLYRQKNSPDNLENIGWSLPGSEGLYNIYIMEEAHSILALGAGGATKLVAPGGKVIKRRFNHKFPADYIQNFPEVLDRKRGVKAFYARYLDSETAG